MTTHKINIEGVPEGWEVVAYRKLNYSEDVYIWLPTHGQPFKCNDNFWQQWVFIVQKTKPRRIVLEETGELNTLGSYCMFANDSIQVAGKGKYLWRIKEE